MGSLNPGGCVTCTFESLFCDRRAHSRKRILVATTFLNSQGGHLQELPLQLGFIYKQTGKNMILDSLMLHIRG